MFLQELFQSGSPYDYKMRESSKHLVCYTFRSDDSSYIEVMFLKNSNGVSTVSFDRDGLYELTNYGDAVKIFATVFTIIKDYISKNKPDYLAWSTDQNEPSRVKLYKRLEKAFSGYKVAAEDDPVRSDPIWREWDSGLSDEESDHRSTLLKRV